MRIHPTLAGGLVLIAACSDVVSSDPCDAHRACEIEGVDLAIVEVTVVGGQHVGADVVTGLPIYAAGAITVEATVVNRGDSISGPQPVTGGGTLPPLEPGETAQATVTVDYTNDVVIHPSWSSEPFDPRLADRRQIEVQLFQDDMLVSEGWHPEDAEPDNNSLQTPAFHVAVPILTGSVSSIEELRVGEQAGVDFEVENLSVHGASTGPISVVLCLWDEDLGCYGDWFTYFGRFEVPDVPAGGSYENAYAASIPMSALVWPEAHQAGVSLCVVPADHSESFLPDPASCIASGGISTVRPDYDSCVPPLLTPTVAVALTDATALARSAASSLSSHSMQRPAPPTGSSSVQRASPSKYLTRTVSRQTCRARDCHSPQTDGTTSSFTTSHPCS